MARVTADDLDGYADRDTYPDGTVVRVFSQRTADPAYSSGWAYALHYGAREPDPPRTLPDGTIRRYDNAHEDTKGHELHVPDQPTQIIQFPAWLTSTSGSGRKSRNRRSTPPHDTPPITGDR